MSKLHVRSKVGGVKWYEVTSTWGAGLGGSLTCTGTSTHVGDREPAAASELDPLLRMRADKQVGRYPAVAGKQHGLRLA